MASSLPPLSHASAAFIRSLLRDKAIRQAERAFVVEGDKAVLDLLAAHPAAVLSVVVTPEYLSRESPEVRRARGSLGGRLYGSPDSLFAKLSNLDNPQGILAVVRQPHWIEETIVRQPEWIGLFGERIQDPTNVGAMIRTAAALNVTALWLTSDSADVFNPKVVRAASGTIMTLPIFHRNHPEALLRQGAVLFAADVSPEETVPLGDIRRVPRRLIVAVGNESQGLSQSVLRQAALRFRIPLSRGVDSLNVAASTAIALFHLGRLPKTEQNNYRE